MWLTNNNESSASSAGCSAFIGSILAAARRRRAGSYLAMQQEPRLWMLAGAAVRERDVTAAIVTTLRGWLLLRTNGSRRKVSKSTWTNSVCSLFYWLVAHFSFSPILVRLKKWLLSLHLGRFPFILSILMREKNTYLFYILIGRSWSLERLLSLLLIFKWEQSKTKKYPGLTRRVPSNAPYICDSRRKQAKHRMERASRQSIRYAHRYVMTESVPRAANYSQPTNTISFIVAQLRDKRNGSWQVWSSLVVFFRSNQP